MFLLSLGATGDAVALPGSVPGSTLGATLGDRLTAVPGVEHVRVQVEPRRVRLAVFVSAGDNEGADTLRALLEAEVGAALARCPGWSPDHRPVAPTLAAGP